MGEANVDQQRLAFGQVAELYESARPSYPAVVVDELIRRASLEPGSRVLEVGAGTGKLTRLLAGRGLAVHALEPDGAMADIAQLACSRHPLVDVEQTGFESWEPRERADALVSAQAWHWIDPRVRYARAGRALGGGGTLVAIWTHADWSRTVLRDELRSVYRETAPGFAPGFAMHPSTEGEDVAGEWHADIEMSDDFVSADVVEHAWALAYSSAEYVQLIQTHQDHILLDPASKRSLLAAISRAIDAAGGSIRVEYVTRLCLARRADLTGT
jgi:trans-aconitate methyltransferase